MAELIILKEAVKICNSKAITNRTMAPKKAMRDYNCWGFTAWMLELRSNLTWLREEEMKKILKEETRRIIKKPKNGDIVSYWSGSILLHTAIITDTDNEIIVHKPGPMPLEVSTINDGWWNNKIKFHRVKKSKRKGNNNVKKSAARCTS